MTALRAWLLLLLLSPALASAELLRLVADPWPPFNDQRLPGKGLSTDLVEQALARAGYTTSYVEVPWERAVLGLKRKDYDVLINAWYSDERAEYGYFSQPYLVNRIRFMQRKGSDIHFETLADLYSHSIAVVRGYAYSKEFDSDPQLLKVGVGSFEIAARMLHAGRVQLALEDEVVARYMLGNTLSSIRDELEFSAAAVERERSAYPGPAQPSPSSRDRHALRCRDSGDERRWQLCRDAAAAHALIRPGQCARGLAAWPGTGECRLHAAGFPDLPAHPDRARR
jgi:polar amino acid transport system substrate-binding protein